MFTLTGGWAELHLWGLICHSLPPGGAWARCESWMKTRATRGIAIGWLSPLLPLLSCSASFLQCVVIRIAFFTSFPLFPSSVTIKNEAHIINEYDATVRRRLDYDISGNTEKDNDTTVSWYNILTSIAALPQCNSTHSVITIATLPPCACVL